MSSGANSPFAPAVTVTVASSSTSANTFVPSGGDVMMITNPTSALAFVRFGADATVVAGSSDTPVLPNSHILLRCGPKVSYCAAVLTSGSGAVMFTRGDGAST